MNVLIVDDHATGRRLLHAVLEAENITVFDAADGVEALAILEHEKVDAIISDILMPRMDGYRLCHEVRSTPRTSRLPFIAYTATYTSNEDEEFSRNLGADRFIKKPASASALVTALHDLLEAEPSRSTSKDLPDGLGQMREYSRRLVEKLEQANIELEAAHARLSATNESLEDRVRVRTADLAAANRQLDSFASFVAHELRAPLRAVEGYLRRLRGEHLSALPAGAQRMISEASAGTSRMERLIDDLLAYCRLDRDRLQKRRVYFDEIVESVIADLRPEWEPRKAEIKVGPLPRSEGDRAMLKQVFLNLISNALKFSRDRAPARIEIGCSLRKGEQVCYVKDNGVGFEMRYAEKIFDVFQQLHRESGFEGTGVGLAIVRNIIERHGGRVWAEAGVDRGATFFFTLKSHPGAAAFVAAGDLDGSRVRSNPRPGRKLLP